MEQRLSTARYISSRMARFALVRVLLFAVAFATPTVGSAQILIGLLFGDKLNSDKLEFGLGVGSSFSTLSNGQADVWGRSLNLGLYFNIKLTEGLYLHASAIPKSILGARSVPLYSLEDADLDSIFADARVERVLPYIHVPLMLRYKSPIQLGVEVGPVVSLRLKKRMLDEFNAEENGDEVALRRKFGELTSPFDFGLGVGLSYKLGQGEGMGITLRYTHGFVDVFKRAEGELRARYPTQRNRQIQLLFEIPVGRGKAKQQEKTEQPLPEGNTN